MTAIITAVHVLVCVFMIAVILLQRGKGAEVGAVFGAGASSTVFGSRGAGNFLTKLTTASAIIFMATSLTLSYLRTQASENRLFDELEGADGAIGAEVAPEEPLFEDLGTVPAPTEAPPVTDGPETIP